MSDSLSLSETVASRSPATSLECGFPDPGTLPAWHVGDLPAPPPFSLARAVREIGPGVILVGGAIGSGEWLLGPALTAKYAGGLLWIATISVFLQSCLNQEAARYALATGEPVFTAYMRCWPSSRWYSSWYLILDANTWWPGLATSAATAVAAGILSARQGAYIMPTADDAFLVTACAYAIFALCVGLVLFGGKIYRMLQITVTFMVIWIFAYLLFVDLALASQRSWALVLGGLVRFGYFPGGQELDWALIAGFAAFAGAGGLNNAATSNYIRDKGWGMGSRVGAIPSAVGGTQVTLSHIGMVFPLTGENIRRFREWWKFVLFDQGAIWGGGALLGIILPAVLAIEFIDPALNLGHWQAAAFQAEGIARRYGGLFWYLTLMCGFWVLFSSQLVVVDVIGRRWSDMIWTGSQAGSESRAAKRIWAGTAAVIGLVLLGGLAPGLQATISGAFLAILPLALGLRWLGPLGWPSCGVAIALATLGLAASSVLSVSELSHQQLWLAATFVYGVPAAIWVVRRAALRMRAGEVEARLLTPLAIVYAVSIIGCTVCSTLELGQRIGPTGAVVPLVSWETTVEIFLFGTAWLVGAAFVLARRMPPHNVYKLYYLVVGMYVTWCVIAMQIATPLTMILIMSNIGGFLLAVTALHTLYVNRRFLPRPLRPHWWKQTALAACAAWYIFMSVMALDARLHAQFGVSLLGWVSDALA